MPDTAKTRKVEIIKDILNSLAVAALNIHFPKIDSYGNPVLGRFLIENGRVPFASDEIKPWSYRGWLVPYLQLCESLPQIAPRYDYVIRSLCCGRNDYLHI